MFPTDWLDSRLELFRRFCLPSVGQQLDKDFRWLVLCDRATGDAHIDALRMHRADCPQLEIHVTDGPAGTLKAVRREIGSSGSDTVVSIRLDSDDALDRRFTAAIADHERAFLEGGHQRWLLNFPLGYKLHVLKDVIVESEMLNSPFHALFEHAQRPLTVLGGNHTNLHETIPVHHDYSFHGWLQVLHGGNLRNRVKAPDKPLTGVDLATRFGIVATANNQAYFDQLPPAAGERLADELDSDREDPSFERRKSDY